MNSTQHPDITMHRPTPFFDFFNWLFGTAVVAAGLLNVLWGNDPGFGVFLIVLSSLYFPPLATLVRSKTGIRVPPFLKILCAIFIIVACLGVGELFDKIDLMMMDL